MFISIDLCFVPIGVRTQLSPYIKICKKIIEDSNLNHLLGQNGTAIEGDWEDEFKYVKTYHEKINQKGAPRIFITIRVNTRTDKL